MLEMPPRSLKYAGIKDKRGKTYQFVTMKGAREERIRSAAKILRNLEVGNFEPTEHDIEIRQNRGNYFKIRIRDIACDQNVLSHILHSIKTNGFINYFGTQRFGFGVGKYNDEIGMALMNHKFKEAFDLYLEPLDGDPRKFEIAKHLWIQNRDPKECINALPQYDVVFRRAFQKILNEGDVEETYRSIWETIPANKIIVSQVASLIWNEMVTKRIEDSGFRIRSGDLLAESGNQLVYNIVEKESLSHDFSDVVLPTPGTNWIDDMHVNSLLSPSLQKRGLSMSSFDVQPINVSASGILRPIIAFPQDFRYTISGGDLFLRLALRPGEYATCFLRELLQFEEITSLTNESR